MSYKILLRDNKTKAEQLVDLGVEWDENSLHWLTEGNFGCDCNRGGLMGHPDHPCGNWRNKERRFTAIEAILEDGKRIPLDEPQDE